jgi:hypothetical protein
MVKVDGELANRRPASGVAGPPMEVLATHAYHGDDALRFFGGWLVFH